MKGCHVFTDNFCTSISLAHYLFKQSTYITGTLCRNRKGIPTGLVGKYNIGESKYYRCNEVLIAGYREKKFQTKPVLLLSANAVAENKTMRSK
jgi:hypothetical protein